MAKGQQAGRKLSALRRRETKECVVCGVEFRGIKKAVYCSNACRQRAKYQRAKLEPTGD